MGRTIMLSFRGDHDENIKKLEEISNREGFFFFNNSIKGEKWINENMEAVKASLTKTLIENLDLKFNERND